ncbi:MAG: Uma2 family endonuclease [Pseudanabaenaceae cyanobacterium]
MYDLAALAQQLPQGERAWERYPRDIPLPTHTDLPCEDDEIVHNFQELPLSILLTTSMQPHLARQRPEGDFLLGHDSGVYWQIVDPPLKGAVSPDWLCVLGVPQTLDGQLRRSYVLWQERVVPTVVVEFVSGTGREERDPTPGSGKFWVYERAIGVPYYLIFDGFRGTLAAFALQEGRYRALVPNANGRYGIPELQVEAGLWWGAYGGLPETLPWLRWWDNEGNLLLDGGERAELERQRAALERQRAETERQEAEAERQRAQAAQQAAEAERQRAQAAQQAAKAERQRAQAAQQAAEAERQRAQAAQQAAEAERQRANEAQRKAERLAARLRALGLDPEEGA